MKISDWDEGESAASHLALGKFGEQLAVDYLERSGYQIVATNFVIPIGYSANGRLVTGEIDIVAYDKTACPFVLALVEVKTRTRSDIAAPETAVDLRKQRQIVRAARLYRRLMQIEVEPFRYDVIGILALPDADAELSLLRNYFTEQRFNRSAWHRQKF
jgi:putative endonuclease